MDSSSPSLWHKAAGRVITGLLLEGFTLNFWGLDILLPAMGHLLILLGLRALRRENRAFHACWSLVLAQTALWLLELWRKAAPGWQDALVSPPGLALRYLSLGLGIAFLLCLRRGLRAVRGGVGLSPGGGGLTVLAACQGMMGLLSALGGGEVSIQIGWLGFLLLAAVWVWIFRGLYRARREVDEAGFVLSPSPVRIPDWALAGAVALAALLGIGAVSLTCNRLPMDWQALPDTPDMVRTEALLDLGFPEAVLADLSAEDIRACDGAVRVVSETGTHAMTNQVVEDAPEPLRLTNVAVELPEGRWRVFHHFRWDDGVQFSGSEAMEIWPVGHHGGAGRAWALSVPCTGRVLCTQGGTDCWAPYYALQEEAYAQTGFPFMTQSGSGVFAAFSFPRHGEHCRGYVTYEALSMQTGYIFDSWANYAHARGAFQYPALSGLEWLKTVGISVDSEPFCLVWNALQFYPDQ